MRRVCHRLVAVIACASVAHGAYAQPVQEPSSAGIADTKIGVSMSGSEVLGAEGVASSAAAASIPLEHPIDPDAYTCGPGDVFELNFWGQQNLRLRIAADLEGRTFISKVGYVSVTGKSLTAARKEIKAKVRSNYPGLQFDLTLIGPRSFLVHVVDNVGRPGSYSVLAFERLSSVLVHAGGATGSRRRISIKHRNGSAVTVDLSKYETTGDTSYNPYLLDGDVVSVPFTEVVVSIGGPVRRPGAYELIKTKDLAELLDLAGGFTTSLTRSLPMRLVRRNAREQASYIDLPFEPSGTPKNIPLQDQDTISVRATDELQRSVLLIGAIVGADPLDQATSTRRLPYLEGDTVMSLISRAGGIKSAGDMRHSYIARPRTGADPELIAFDLEALLVRRDFAADKPVAMGDTIVIPPMQYSVLVEGAVAHAGMFNYNPMFGVREYIARAGGTSRMAQSMGDIKVIDQNGTTRSYRSTMKIAPGDSILVPERNFSRSEVVQLVLAGASLVLSGITIAYLVKR